MARKNQEASLSVTESVTMDTRKFLSAINSSAQAQVVHFENLIGRLGEKQGSNWSLTALQGNRVFFEDTENNQFYVADHTREKGGRIKISNIKAIQLEESKKSDIFESACNSLIDSIEEGDDRGIEAAYRKLSGCRFRSAVIPESGIVRTKDGVIRSISVDTVQESTSGYDLADQIIESLSDKYTLNEDGILESAVIGEEPPSFDLPVTELTSRKIVAKHFKETALRAWVDPNFATLVEKVAALVSNDRLEEAVKYSAAFLAENQEFCLLNRDELRGVVDNALATKASLNEALTEDTTTLLYKTNLKVNRESLVDAWTKTAQVANHPVMMENCRKLSEAKNFNEAYENFLGVIFEVAGETTIGALITGLELLQKEVANSNAEDPTVEDIQDLITNLKTKGDSDSVWTAMETLDGVRRHTDRMAGLDDFDSIPGPGGDEVDLGGDAADALGGGDDGMDVGGGEGGDKPLEISIKMDPAKIAAGAQDGGAEPDLAGGLDDIAPEEGGEEESDDDFLAGLDDMGLEDEDEGPAPFEGKEGGEAISESPTPQPKPEKTPAFVAKAQEMFGADPSELNDNQIYAVYLESSCDDDEEEGDDLDDAPTGLAHQVEEALARVNFLIEQGISTKEDVLQQAGVSESVEEEEVDTQQVEGYQLPEDLLDEEDLSINTKYGMVREAVWTDADAETWSNSLEQGSDDDPAALQASAEAWVRQQRADLVGSISDPVRQQEEVNKMAGELVALRQAKKQGMTENQFKSPLKQLSRRGLKKAAVNELVKEGKLTFTETNAKAASGRYKGVGFVIDNSESPVALLNLDASMEIPIPEELVPGALYLAEMSEDEANADAFVEFLDQNIESLRISESDEKAIEEALQKIEENTGGDSDCEGDDCHEDADQGQEPVNESGKPWESDDDGGDDEGSEEEASDDEGGDDSANPFEGKEGEEEAVNEEEEADESVSEDEESDESVNESESSVTDPNAKGSG